MFELELKQVVQLATEDPTQSNQPLPRIVLLQMEAMLTYETFMEWTRPDMMDEVEVNVGLPRFKMTQTYDMKDLLVSMGMVDAFDMGLSDFSGRDHSAGLRDPIVLVYLKNTLLEGTILLSIKKKGISNAEHTVVTE